MSADSSGNGHSYIQFAPQYHRGHFGVVLGRHKCKFGKAAKRMDRLVPNSVNVCVSMNGHRLKTTRPRYPTAAFRGVLGGQQFKSLGNVVKRLDRLGINGAHIMQVNLGMDTG